MAVRFLQFYKNVRKRIVDRIINYLDSLNKSGLDTVLDLYNRYQMLLWGCPIILWVANLVLLVFPFHNLINISRKSRDFSHGMDRPLLSPFMGLFVYLCIFLIIDIFLNNFFTHITQCAHIVTR